jgi:beta-N-acetylhexosaminidase
MTSGTGEPSILGHLMLAFEGVRVPGWVVDRLATAPVAGFTLFRPLNVRSPGQVRRLTAGLQAAARNGPQAAGGSGLPLLIAADQEGGQLQALGPGWTVFGGPMALGATGDAALAQRVGRAIGLEMRAVGVNINYAPVLDVASNPANPSLGIRSFGDDPAAVARLGSAWVRGVQSAGVAATVKHFPGSGAIGVDTHHELAVIDRDRAEVEATDLRPFKAAIDAGARVVMSGHFASPALTGSRSVPSTLAPEVMDRLLRDELGFRGVSITDALDMHALAQDENQAVDVVAAIRAGVDLLLATAEHRARRRIEEALLRAAELRLFDPGALHRSGGRVEALRRWIAGYDDPGPDVVGSADHAGLARELDERSLTLVRDDGLLPLRLAADARILAIMPAPRDLTPADTSSLVRPGLADALRARHPHVDEVVTAHPPTAAEIAALRDRAAAADLIVVGTISAAPGSPQAQLAAALVATGRPLVSVALRTPWDIVAYPMATTHVCTYSILPGALAALAAALFSRAGRDSAFPGRLPVAVPGIAAGTSR